MASSSAFATNSSKYVIDLCGHCRKDCEFKCSSCNISSYCSAACQKSDWKEHRLLMDCSRKKKKPEKNDAIDENDSEEEEEEEEEEDIDRTIALKNQIRYNEMMKAQTLLTYTFLIDDFRFYGQHTELEEYLEMRTKKIQDNGFPLETTYICEALLDKPLFEDFEGAVYYHNSCFGAVNDMFDDHLPHQDFVKIADGETTKLLTSRELIQKISNGVEASELNFAQYESNDLRPLFLCTEHKDINDIRLYQFKDGVLVLVSCY